jgi:hypothetical protein
MNSTTATEDGSAASRPVLLDAVTPEHVSDAIKAAGGAVSAIEQDGVLRLHSASHGIGFQVLWGNSMVPGHFTDFTLSCPLRVQGGVLPLGLLDAWHASKRFARVSQHGEYVVLEMDVLAAGGVSAGHLAVAIQLWMQMMGQFFLFLRDYKPNSLTPVEGRQGQVAANEENVALA